MADQNSEGTTGKLLLQAMRSQVPKHHPQSPGFKQGIDQPTVSAQEGKAWATQPRGEQLEKEKPEVFVFIFTESQ